MRFSKLPKDQIYLTVVLGCITSYFVWAEPFKLYTREHITNNNLNETNLLFQRNSIMTKVKKRWVSFPARLMIGVTCCLAFSFYYKSYIVTIFKKNSYKQAEGFADIVYENYKERENVYKR